jgi:hypothetical protein
MKDLVTLWLFEMVANPGSPGTHIKTLKDYKLVESGKRTNPKRRPFGSNP